MLRFICLILILVGGYYWYDAPEASHPPGILVSTAPVVTAAHISPWQKDHYKITALDSFAIVARVLSKSHYVMGREADLSAYDLVLGWQQMSDSSVLNQLDISQSNRWYHYAWHTNPPIADALISTESGNMHIIAGTDDVLHSLRSIVKGNVVALEGYLVRVEGDDGWVWASGMGSDSSGPHGCKLIWVTKLLILQDR